MSLLQVPRIIFSSMRKMCLPGKPLAHPRPERSLIAEVCEYGLYSALRVPFPALKPIYSIKQ